MSRITGTLAEELARYEARCTRSPEGCLLGPGKSYGELRYDRGSRIPAHRAAYTVHVGTIPAEMLIRHTCDEPRCIEPTHLLIGTGAENAADMAERKRGLIGLRHHFAATPPELVQASVAEYLRGGVSQDVMAARLGVARSTFGRWVRAESRRDVALTRFVAGLGSRHAVGLKPCGTKAGYERHHHKGTPVCDPCRQAHRSYMRAYKARRRQERAA